MQCFVPPEKGEGIMFEHILIPLDGSRLAECVLPHGVALAQAFGARVTLLQALERPPRSRPKQVR